MADIFKNILIIVLAIAALLGGFYLFLVILGWGLKLKIGRREQEGLTELWVAAQKQKSPSTPSGESTSDDNS